MTARARLDADRTAEPLTRIEHHPPHGGCISPYMPLVNPEYVDENGKRTPLSAPVAAADPLETDRDAAIAAVGAAREGLAPVTDPAVRHFLFAVDELLYQLARARKAGDA